MNISQTIKYWITGIRLYIAAGIGLLTLQVWWWGSIVFDGSPDLMASRMHEVYGWLSLLMLAVTLAVGPIYKIAPKLPGALMMRDARRMLGIGTAWFALLHVVIAYFESLKAVNPLDLAATYQKAFFLGLAAMLILITLALISFDKAMRDMGKWWFRLQRLAYLAVVLIVWHTFMVGVHATSLTALAIVIGVALVLFTFHIHMTLQSGRTNNWQILALCATFLALLALSNYGIQQYIDQNSLQGHGHR